MVEVRSVDLDRHQPGSIVGELATAAISRHVLALYCGASADHNPIHVDSDFARAAGMADVFAHGMLVMAYLGRLLTQIAPVENHRRFSARFQAITHVGDAIVCTARLVRFENAGSERRAVLELQAANQSGETKLTGEAVVALRGGT